MHQLVNLLPVLREDDHRHRVVVEHQVRSLLEQVGLHTLTRHPRTLLFARRSGPLHTSTISSGDVEVKALCRHLVTVYQFFELLGQVVVVTIGDVILVIIAGHRTSFDIAQ